MSSLEEQHSKKIKIKKKKNPNEAKGQGHRWDTHKITKSQNTNIKNEKLEILLTTTTDVKRITKGIIWSALFHCVRQFWWNGFFRRTTSAYLRQNLYSASEVLETSS